MKSSIWIAAATSSAHCTFSHGRLFYSGSTKENADTDPQELEHLIIISFIALFVPFINSHQPFINWVMLMLLLPLFIPVLISTNEKLYLLPSFFLRWDIFFFNNSVLWFGIKFRTRFKPPRHNGAHIRLLIIDY